MGLVAIVFILSVIYFILPISQLQNPDQGKLKQMRKRSAEIEERIRDLAKFIVAELETEYPDVFWPQGELSVQLGNRNFTPSVGISIDPEGKADSKNSMVYLWAPKQNRSDAVFVNTTTLIGSPPKPFPIELGDHLGDTVQLITTDGGSGSENPEPEGEGLNDPAHILVKRRQRHHSLRRFKRKGGGGGGGRGGGGFGGGGRGGAGAGGRGFSAARSASSASRSSSFGRSAAAGSSRAGIGGTRPFVWVYVGGGGYHHGGMAPAQAYARDKDFNPDSDTNSESIRIEVSICFGRHKSRESCSAKVDSMVEKFAYEKFEQSGSSTETIRYLSWLSFVVPLLILML